MRTVAGAFAKSCVRIHYAWSDFLSSPVPEATFAGPERNIIPKGPHEWLGPSMMPRCLFRHPSACLYVGLSCVTAFGADTSQRTIFQLQHAAWTAREGAPGPNFALAQTTDGYLWLGTLSGLYRFDGVNFERYKPLSGRDLTSNDVSALKATSDGGLWIGFRYGGADFLKDGRVVSYMESDGFPSGTVRRFAIDRQGTIWAQTYGGIGRFDGSRWERVGTGWGYLWNSARDILVDRAGTLWVSNADTVVFLRQGEKTFQKVTEPVEHPSFLTEAPDGAVWVLETPAAGSPLVRPVATSRTEGGGPSPKIRVATAFRFMFDRAGNLWITAGGGVIRVRPAELLNSSKAYTVSPALDKFSRKEGLTSDTPVSLLEDREGNIWVGTYSGLDRFRETNVVPAAPQFNTDAALLVAGDQADVWSWVFSTHEPPGVDLLHLRATTVDVQRVEHGLSCTYRDPQGVIWVGGPDGVWRFANGRFDPVPLPDDAPKKREVQAIARDRSGNLWVSLVGAGTFFRTNGTWTHPEKLAELLKPTAVSLMADTTGRIWSGYIGNKISVFDGNTVRSFTSANGLNVVNIQAIHEHSGHIWAGGGRGLALYREDRFQAFNADGGLAFDGISGIVETARGDLWLNAISGIIRVPAVEISRAVENPKYLVRCERFDFADGLLGKAPQVRPLPTAVQTSDGQLWFLTTSGIVRIDPEHLTRNTIPPSVFVRSIDSGGKAYPATGVKLPVGTKSVHIEYTATSLSAPERVRFRYKLEGVDDVWQEAGTRREAFYTNLRPRQYRFRVIACNNDGIWNEAGAVWDLSIAPAFYQADWFRPLAAFAFALMVWGVYQLRVRQLTARLNLRHAERLAERTRIARELHDTLLQSFQGLMLRFLVVDEMLPPGKAKETLGSALERADQAIVEGRDAVHDLRMSTIATNELAQAVRTLGDELASQDSATFRLTVEGSPRDLYPILRDDVYRIAGEALRNAFLHARAQRIEAEITYAERQFRLRIRDDGNGIAPEILQEGRAGHYGLPGIRERATEIGGKLNIRSGAGSGTEIDLSIPGSIAYETSPGGRWFRQFWKKGA